VRPLQLLGPGAKTLLPLGGSHSIQLQKSGKETQPESMLQSGNLDVAEQPTPAAAENGSSSTSSSSSAAAASKLPLLSSLERLAAGFATTLSTPAAGMLVTADAPAANAATADVESPDKAPLLGSLERLAEGFASTLSTPEAGMLLSAADASSLDAEVAAVEASLAAANLEAGRLGDESFEQPQQRILAATQQARPAANTPAAAAKPAPKPAATAGKPAAAKPAAAKPPAAKHAQAKETTKKHSSTRTTGVQVAAARLAQQQPVFDEDYTPGDDSPIWQGPDAPTAPVPAAPVPAAPVPAAPQESTAPLYISPPTSFESLTEVNLDQALLQIPQSFLGISHEWTHVEEINNIPGYKDIIRLLTSYGSGPFNIRIGGGSTDKQAYVFPQYVYDALRQVHEETGAQYIMSVNLESGDTELSRAQLKMIKDHLPASAVVATEIGNEVGDWPLHACSASDRLLQHAFAEAARSRLFASGKLHVSETAHMYSMCIQHRALEYHMPKKSSMHADMCEHC
jgi:hypothetical protein